MVDFTEEPTITETSKENGRREYTTPTLTDYGAIAELTEGSFAGVGIDNAIYS